jgi:hypothetical protein
MDDDGSALRVGAKYKSFTDLECALKLFQQDNYVQLYRRSSRKLGTGSKYIYFFQLWYYVFIFLHQVQMFFQYISNEVSYVYKSSL